MKGSWTIQFNWSECRGVLDGWLPKLAITVPIVGYAVLFNDSITQFITFENIAKEPSGFLSSADRLRSMYFGLIFLGFSNLVYLIACPKPQRLARNEFDYASYALSNFTWIEIQQVFEKVGEHAELTAAQRAEWDTILGSMQNPSSLGDSTNPERSWQVYRGVFGDTLRQILATNYRHHDESRDIWMNIALILGAVGYSCLAIPAIELFTRVVSSVF